VKRGSVPFSGAEPFCYDLFFAPLRLCVRIIFTQGRKDAKEAGKMNERTLADIVAEIAPVLIGRTMGKVFQLSRVHLAIDFRPGDGSYLFISVEPSQPRIHMIERRVRDLEKQSLQPSGFFQLLRKHLGGAQLVALSKDENDRILRFSFNALDEAGMNNKRTLVAQLTGKSANLLLLDDNLHVIDALRTTQGEGQRTGELYQPPATHVVNASAGLSLEPGNFKTLSEAADEYYRRQDAERLFNSRAATARARLRKEITQREKLLSHLADDLKSHGDADEHKRIGDLLLANITSAERRGSRVVLTDYYADGAPLIELEVDENSTLQEEAARRFSRYTKARRAAQEIAARIGAIEDELNSLKSRQTELDQIMTAKDEEALDNFNGEGKVEKRGQKLRPAKTETIPGVRRYRSSDGYEILVGRAARDNDHLTFRVARPQDIWLHAADYPGSHVVIRNPTRAEIPHRTIIEAAQLAAAFSQARRDAKVSIHYTQRKFLSKPKGAAPGLVRMSSFRSLLVEPREAIERI
jgi:predicted ribosome quality control (RQC) complex YloA/Tae2 family protein